MRREVQGGRQRFEKKDREEERITEFEKS